MSVFVYACVCVMRVANNATWDSNPGNSPTKANTGQESHKGQRSWFQTKFYLTKVLK